MVYFQRKNAALQDAHLVKIIYSNLRLAKIFGPLSQLGYSSDRTGCLLSTTPHSFQMQTLRFAEDLCLTPSYCS